MADQAPPAWVITAQMETTDVGPQGTYVSGVKVTFRTAAGVMGSVFVPQADYTVDRIRALINERAAVMDNVAGLTG